jgi:hypothetical protein
MRFPVDPPVLEFDAYGNAGRLTFDPRRTPATDAFATMLSELAAMIGSGQRTHPCDVHRGVHLQWVIAEAHRLATRCR